MRKPPEDTGLFTTLRVREGRCWFWEDHLERLAAGARRFGLVVPDPAELRSEIDRVTHGLPDARVRISLLPGGTHRVEGRAFEPDPGPWTLSCVVVTPEEDTVRFKTDRRGVYQQARLVAGRDREPLLVDGRGAYLECTIANLFLVRGPALLTPPASAPLLPGIARKRVIEAALALGYEVREERIGESDARASDGCFATNALRVIQPVAAIDGVREFGPCRLARALMRALASRWRINV